MNYNLEFPAVRGIQAGRPFYLASVPFSVLGRLLQLDTAGAVMDRSQREVNETRSKAVSSYIINNPDSFIIPSLTGVINSDEPVKFLSTMDDNGFSGVLSVPMAATIKLFDGQTRATGIIRALQDKLSLASEMIPIMLFCDMSLADRQQAFSDINGTMAKPQQALCDSYNTRDGLPRLAKHISNNCYIFNGLIEFETNSITAKSSNLFPIKTIKDASQILLGLKKKDDITEEHKEIAVDFWQAVGDALNWSLSAIEESGLTTKEIRTETVKTHTVMIKALATAGNHLIKNSTGGVSSIEWNKLKSLNFNRDGSDFYDRCINSKNGALITNVTALKLTTNKLITTLGGKLTDEMMELEDLHFEGKQCYMDACLDNPITLALKSVFPERTIEKLERTKDLIVEAFEANEKFVYIDANDSKVTSDVNEFIKTVVATHENKLQWTNARFVQSEVTKFCTVEA